MESTEFRQFLLYTGQTVLKNRLRPLSYKNYMVLSVSIRLLLSNEPTSVVCNYVEKLLKSFVEGLAKCYVIQNLAYNAHSLTHVVKDVRKYGSLINISCFPFENYDGYFKKLVR